MSFPVEKKCVAIIGLGLLGASLGLALKKSGIKRLGWARRSETRQWCLEHDVIDQTFDTFEETVAVSDITILCMPLPVIIEVLEKYASSFKKGSIVTDIGSDKCSSIVVDRVVNGLHYTFFEKFLCDFDSANTNLFT